MTIKKKLQITAIASFGLLSIVVIVLSWAVYRDNRAKESERIATDIIKNSFEREALRDDYLLYGEERTRIQWQSKHEQIGKLLNSASERFKDSERRFIVSELQRTQESIGRIFSQILKNRQGKKLNENKIGYYQWSENRLISQLVVKSYDMVSYAVLLKEDTAKFLEFTRRSVTFLTVFLILATMIIAALNSLSMSRILARRIEALRAGAEFIGRGDLDYRIDIRGNDEFSDLARKNNEMAEKLKKSYTALEKEVAERKLAEDEVKQLNDKLTIQIDKIEAANKELESFTYSVSHDLRSPLRAIDGFARMLLEDYADKIDSEGNRYLSVIRDNATGMGQLIDDLLSFSRIGRQSMKFSEIDIGEMAKAVFEELKADIAGRDVTFNLIPPLLSARGDMSLVRQVFVNLISNAIKFTMFKANSQIEVGGCSGDKNNTYYVKDNGAGFDMQYYNKLFGVFQRLHKNEEFEGTGVGLAIVHRIVQRHGGRVWAEGKVNEGAKFYFTLPRASGDSAETA